MSKVHGYYVNENEFPRHKNGNYDYNKMIGMTIEFVYYANKGKEYTGSFIFVDYQKVDGKRNIVTINYNGRIGNIRVTEFKRCSLGSALGIRQGRSKELNDPLPPKPPKPKKEKKPKKDKFLVGGSYPERVMSSILRQLDINAKREANKTTADWMDKYRYDFYFIYNNEQYIIEMNGGQHYKDVKHWKLTLEEVQANDKAKYNIAIDNGIVPENYIIIDCSKSDIQYIKDNILNSRLTEVFNLDIIDWIKVEDDATYGIIDDVMNIMLTDSTLTRNNVADMLGLSKTVAGKYRREAIKRLGIEDKAKNKSKRVKVVDYIDIDGNEMVFDSISECARSLDLDKRRIEDVLHGRQKTHKGYRFVFVPDEE